MPGRTKIQRGSGALASLDIDVEHEYTETDGKECSLHHHGKAGWVTLTIREIGEHGACKVTNKYRLDAGDWVEAAWWEDDPNAPFDPGPGPDPADNNWV